MGPRIRIWLDDDRTAIHHAAAAQIEGMHAGGGPGTTDCGNEGMLKLVHHENVDMGILCEGCMAVTGPNPALEGEHPGPV